MELKLNSPVKWFLCCKKCLNLFVIFTSVCTVSLFIITALEALPTIAFVYYLYPVRTLARLPFLANIVVITNTLIALLLFQCERCWLRIIYRARRARKQNHQAQVQGGETYGSTGNDTSRDNLSDEEDEDIDFDSAGKKLLDERLCICDRLTDRLANCLTGYPTCCMTKCPLNYVDETLDNYEKFYLPYYSTKDYKKRHKLTAWKYICQPLGTLIVLLLLIVFMYILYNLFHLDTKANSDLSEFLLVVPSLVVMYGALF